MVMLKHLLVPYGDGELRREKRTVVERELERLRGLDPAKAARGIRHCSVQEAHPEAKAVKVQWKLDMKVELDAEAAKCITVEDRDTTTSRALKITARPYSEAGCTRSSVVVTGHFYWP